MWAKKRISIHSTGDFEASVTCLRRQFRREGKRQLARKRDLQGVLNTRKLPLGGLGELVTGIRKEHTRLVKLLPLVKKGTIKKKERKKEISFTSPICDIDCIVLFIWKASTSIAHSWFLQACTPLDRKVDQKRFKTSGTCSYESFLIFC